MRPDCEQDRRGPARPNDFRAQATWAPRPYLGLSHAPVDVGVALGAAANILIEQIADQVAHRVLAEVAAHSEPSSPWLDVFAACAYLGLSKDALYKLTAAHAIPFRRKAGGQGLRFHQAELDAWMEEAYPRVDRLA